MTIDEAQAAAIAANFNPESMLQLFNVTAQFYYASTTPLPDDEIKTRNWAGDDYDGTEWATPADCRTDARKAGWNLSIKERLNYCDYGELCEKWDDDNKQFEEYFFEEMGVDFSAMKEKFFAEHNTTYKNASDKLFDEWNNLVWTKAAKLGENRIFKIVPNYEHIQYKGKLNDNFHLVEGINR